jgi:uncharacterized protein YbjT (DUF2867 family)
MILIVGATGILGGMIARQLLEAGKQVRILARENSPAEQMAQQGMATSPQSLLAAGVEPVYGDLKEPASLASAVEGIDTVITTANSAMRGGEDNLQAVDVEGNRNLIEAAQQAGVKHFIFVSALGATPDSPVPFMQAKGQTEERLRHSGMTYTILAPNVFMEVWIPAVVLGPVMVGEPVTLIGEGRRKHSFVAIQDVAAFVANAVDNPAAYNQYIAIGGPEPTSWQEIVAVTGQVLGRKIPVRSVAPGEPIPHLPGPMSGLLAAMETYDSPLEMTETARTFGVSLTPMEQAVRQLTGQRS